MILSEHVSKAFDAELSRLGALIDTLADLANQQIEAVFQAAERKDHATLEAVIAREPKADRLEHGVDRLVIHILALRQPMAVDLRLVLSAFRVGIELERICDHAKDMAERFEGAVSAGRQRVDAVVALGRFAAHMLAEAVRAYRQGDVSLAKAVRARDRELDAAYTTVFRDLLGDMREDAGRISADAQLLFIARDIERIGDLATDIAEMACYLVLGEPVEDERPKADRTKTIALPPAD